MDKKSADSTRDERLRNTRRARSASQPSITPSSATDGSTGSPLDPHDESLLAHFAASAGVSNPGNPRDSHEPFFNFLRALQGAYPSFSPPPEFFQQPLPPNFPYQPQAGPSQLPLSGYPNTSWGPLPQISPPGSFGDPGPSFNPATIPFFYGGAPYASPPGFDASSSTPHAPPSSADRSRSRSVSSPDLEQTEAERLAVAEDKRRRNTAASARFRTKKKQRTLNLERSVSDLSGRAEDLEREVTDLRRENSWLKEIIMMKGSRLARSMELLQTGEGSGSKGGSEFQTNKESKDHEKPSNPSEDSDEETAGTPEKGGRKEKDKGKGKAVEPK